MKHSMNNFNIQEWLKLSEILELLKYSIHDGLFEIAKIRTSPLKILRSGSWSIFENI